MMARSWRKSDLLLHEKTVEVLVPLYALADNTENLGKFTQFSLSNIDKETGYHGCQEWHFLCR